MTELQQAVLWPRDGLRNGEWPDLPAASDAGEEVEPRVVGRIARTTARVVLASPAWLARVREERPELEVAPVVFYRLARNARPVPRTDVAVQAAAAPATRVRVRVRDARSGAAVAGADVRAFTDFEQLIGAKAITDAHGVAALDLGAAPVFVERLYVYPPLVGYWGTQSQNRQLHDGDQFSIEPIDLSVADGFRAFIPNGLPGDGTGVKVAVVDTGVGPHVDRPADGDPDNGDGHGTHVAGIIGGRGTLPGSLPGVAPAVEIVSLRVFAPNGSAPNFTVAEAIEQAVAQRCDLINLSLVFLGGEDPVVSGAVEDAFRRGCVCVAAAGNEGRRPVGFPASHPKVVAVSALGKLRTYPAESIDELDEREPFGSDAADFIAAFSNVGPEIDLTAPGVGTISTVPGGYGWMSGTSMACPAVTGVAARRLAREPAILAMDRDETRASRIARLVVDAARALGFPTDLEGRGLAD